MTRPDELALSEIFDFDGDGDDDLLTVSQSESSYVLSGRRAGMDGLGDVISLDALPGPVSGLEMRRTGSGRPAEAIVTTTCDDEPCVERRLSLVDRLLPVDEYEKAVESPPLQFVGFAPR
jgi:hypothetical protein